MPPNLDLSSSVFLVEGPPKFSESSAVRNEHHQPWPGRAVGEPTSWVLHQGGGFNPVSAPKPEPPDRCISKWNDKSMSLFHSLPPLLSLSLKIN